MSHRAAADPFPWGLARADAARKPPAMTSSLIPFGITVCGIAELPEHSDVGISHVLSILDPEWPVPDAFGSFGEHARLELRFHDIIEPTPGMVLPRRSHVEEVLAFGRDLMSEPAGQANLLVHCHAGISRSTASMLLILTQALPRVPVDALAAEVLRIRDKAWPNLMLIEMGDDLLGRGGAIVRAARWIYGEQIRRKPGIGEMMREGGRGREVDSAQV
jgi:predicted protein tyrosine phosphatase